MYIFKKIGFYVFLIFSLASAGVAYFYLKDSKAPKSNVVEHIPSSTMSTIETVNVGELVSTLTHQNLLWNLLLNNPAISKTQNAINYFDSIFKSDKVFASLLSNNNVFLSFLKNGNTVDILLQFKLKERKDDEAVNTFFKTHLTDEKGGASFAAFSLPINSGKCYACYVDGIVYFCSDFSVLQKCVDLNKSVSLAANTNYLKLSGLNGNQKTKIYIDHGRANLFSEKILNGESVFNLTIGLNELSLNGYTNKDSASQLFLTQGQSELRLREFGKLPDHVCSFYAFAVNDAKVFFKNVDKNLSNCLATANAKAWRVLNEKALYDIKQECYDNISGEIIVADYQVNNNACELLQMKINDEDKAVDFLKCMSDSAMDVSGKNIFVLNKSFCNLFAFNAESKNMEYACIHSSNLVFISDTIMLQHYVAGITNSAVLSKNSTFNKYANENLAQACNFLFYENNMGQSSGKISSFIIPKQLSGNTKIFSQISVSAKNQNAAIQLRIHFNHLQPETSSGKGSNNNAIWEYEADTSIVSGVYIFKNHVTTENELCLQDADNTFYLINTTGNIIWKKSISEKINSHIFTVDVFKNGKCQMLFSSENYLHLLDRNGNYVQGYPVRVPQRMTSPITLLDYENNMDYRIFFACADKKIYNYSLYGVKTEGFKPVKTLNEVALPLLYAKVGVSDYLITADVEGKLYAFSRKGEDRIDFKNTLIKGLRHLHIEGGSNLNNTKIIYVDDKNNLLDKISLSDKKEALKLGDELNEFNASFNLFNDDKQTDVILFGDGAIYAYDLFSEKLFESFDDKAVYRNAVLLQYHNSLCVMAFDEAGHKINVISMEGKIIFSFSDVTAVPLVTELYNDGKKYMITTQHKRISCMRMD